MLLSTHLVPSILGLLAACRPARANAEALWLEPSLKWYGIDGNWSAMGLYVGEPAQQVDVTVSTALAEIWVVDDGGCGSSALCTAARGNVFNVSASTSWNSLGAWELGLDYLGQPGNGDYAMETVVVYDSVTRKQTDMHQQIVAAINDTDYYTGFFGLGITPGRFRTTVVQSPIAALVERDGIIPSHSYGYTAGAYYGGQFGTPMSLTLGGYDENRFINHSTTFSLNGTSRLPEALIRGISASVTSVDKAPTAWNSTTQSLMSFNESVTALIDSSTPYLWLPTAVCDRFAAALNLTWNETFGLYLFANTSVYNSFADQDLSFTFSLSSFDNTDNFGNPLAVPGVVNITISANAFAQTLRYPFMNAIAYGEAAIPYFPLRRTTGNDSQFIIGRSFMQEAYIVTNYETSTFSVHQALFPENPAHNTSIVTLTSAEDSPYPGPANSSEGGLSTPAIVGIVIGACLIGLSILFTVWWMRRRRTKQLHLTQTDSMKDGDSCMYSEPPTTPVARIFSRFARVRPGARRSASGRGARGAAHEVTGDTNQPVEVGGQERYEMAVPPPPAELDAADAHSIHDDTTELGTEGTQDVSSYEVARRKMERQLQGPVPEYTPGQFTMETPHDGAEKSHQDISSVPHYRPSNRSLRSDNSFSPASTPTYDNYSFYSIPSPMTPHYGEWPREWPGSSGNGIPEQVPDLLYSPTTLTSATGFTRSVSNPGSAYTPNSLNTYDQQSLGRSISSGSPRSNPATLAPPGPSFQRTPIDPTKVVCLGPLPDNIRPPHPSAILRFGGGGGGGGSSSSGGAGPSPDMQAGPPGPSFVMPTMPTIPSAAESRRQSTVGSRRRDSTDTLGSNFTVEQEAQLREEIERNGTVRIQEESEEHSDVDHDLAAHTTGTLELSYAMGGGLDLVHIPEPPRPSHATPNAERLGSRADFVHIPTPISPNVVSTSAAQRITGADLVHVPQPASKRYSWEES